MLWQQLGTSFQNHISQLSDYAKSNESKLCEWLWGAYESACHGIVQLDKNDALSSALLILTGMKRESSKTFTAFISDGQRRTKLMFNRKAMKCQRL